MALPIVRGATFALYPFTKKIRCLTGIQTFENANEQRWVVRPPLVDFVFPFNKVTHGNLVDIRAQHISAKGQQNTTLSMTLNGVNYTNMAFTEDSLSFQETTNTLYTTQIGFRQTVPQQLLSNANAGVYPRVSGGIAVADQLPWVQTTRSQTYVVDKDEGPRYAFGLFGNALINFPGRQLAARAMQYDMLPDAQLTVLEQFFIAMNGRYGKFSFQDQAVEGGTNFLNMRFDSDTFEALYIGPNHTQVTVSIVETNN